MADRVGVIFEGRLIDLEDADRFLETSKDPRTEAFIEGKIPY
jgi:ABC-type phosphate transport system ATPase subunit